MTSTEKDSRIQKCNTTIKQLKKNLFYVSSENIRLKQRNRSLKESLNEYAIRGNMKAILHLLDKAYKAGKFKERSCLLDTLQSISHKLNANPKGKRHKGSNQMFYEVLLTLGGPKLAKFVAANLEGPDLSTIYRWRTKNRLNLELGINANNFKKLAELYKEIKSANNIDYLVPVLLAEDETSIIPNAEYSQSDDTITGF